MICLEPLRAARYASTFLRKAFPSISLTLHLGNTSDQDSDREPEPPPAVADKPVNRSGKRDAPKEAPSEARGGRGGRGGRRGGFTGSEQGTFFSIRWRIEESISFSESRVPTNAH